VCEYAGVHIGYAFVVSCAYNIALYGHIYYIYIYAWVSNPVARIHLSGIMEGSRIVRDTRLIYWVERYALE